jgi:hypothetical protein
VDKHLENSNFIETLLKNESNSINEFIIEHGKEGKPFCPISFEKQEEGCKDEK